MNEIDSALKVVYGSLPDSDITWVLTGSFAFYIRGMDVSVGDIDIQTDENGAYEIERRLKQYTIEPVQFRQAPKLRSNFGKLVIGGVQVEVMTIGWWIHSTPAPSLQRCPNIH
ncbi:MAG: hypothetical protein K6T83_17410 [Alicyclobacillus sp.]|nr:hypothetical protein [Alicyclobacillus sp.]